MLILLLLSLCLIVWGAAAPWGRGSRIVRLFLKAMGRLLGLGVRVEGRPAHGMILYVANHISWLDILAIGGVSGCRFVAKAEIERWPLIGWVARIGGTVFISRDRRAETRVQADRVSAALRGARPVTLFAEGGTGDGLTLAPFRAPLFAAAIEAGAGVQPVAIDYGPGRSAYAWPDGSSLSAEMKRILNRREHIPVTLRFLAPLDARRLDRKALAARSHAAIAAALG